MRLKTQRRTSPVLHSGKRAGDDTHSRVGQGRNVLHGDARAPNQPVLLHQTNLDASRKAQMPRQFASLRIAAVKFSRDACSNFTERMFHSSYFPVHGDWLLAPNAPGANTGTVEKFAGKGPVKLSRNETMSRTSRSSSFSPSCTRAMMRTACGKVAAEPS
jgi:hypothetical protein